MVFRIGVYQPKNVDVLVDQELCSHKSLVFVNPLEFHEIQFFNAWRRAKYHRRIK